MKNLIYIILLLIIVRSPGCLSSGGSSSDDSSSTTTTTTTTTNGTRTLSGYAKGKLPTIYTSSSSAPSRTLTNPSEWTITLTDVSDERSSTPDNNGEFSIPIYDTDYLNTSTKIKVTRNSKVIAGNSILEKALIYSVNSTDSLVEPTISIGFFSNNTYILLDSSSDSSSLYSAWSKISSKDYSSAITEFTSILSSTSSDNVKASANAGIGWAKVKSSGGKLSDGKTYFQQSYSLNNLAKIGLNYVYISETDNIMTAITNFESLGLSSTTYEYNEAEILGISNKELFSSLAYCYIYIGDYESANKISNTITSSSEDICEQVSKIMTEFGVN